MADRSLGYWRTERHNPRSLIYSPDGTTEKEVHKGVMYDPADGPRVAEALNGSHSPELAAALTLLVDFVDSNPCNYDHNNECQEHGFYDDSGDPNFRCPHAVAKDFLHAHGYPYE